MSRTVHLRVDIRGMLLRSDRDLVGVLRDDDGNDLSPRDARLALMDELQSGANFVKCGPCDNWSPTEGCLGHDDS